MADGDNSTLREFLISLGWHNDDAGERKFIHAIEGATLRAKLLGDALEDMARRVGAAIAGMAEDFEQLYWHSDRTKESAKNLKVFEDAIAQVGGSADDAAASVETMAAKLRENPGNIAILNKLGFELDKATGKIKFNAELAQKGIGSMSMAAAEQYRALAGMDERTFLAIRNHGAELDRFMADRADSLKRSGFDPDQAAADGVKFEQTWRSLFARLGDIGSKFYDDLLRDLTGPLDELNKFIKAHETEISTALGDIAKAVGDIIDRFAHWIEANSEWIRTGIVGAIKDFATWIGKIDWDRVGKGLSDFAKGTQSLIDAMGGLKTAIELMFGLWVASKVAPIITALTLMTSGAVAFGKAIGAANTAATTGLFGTLSKLGSLARLFSFAALPTLAEAYGGGGFAKFHHIPADNGAADRWQQQNQTDTRSMWQRLAPSWLGGKPPPVALNVDGVAVGSSNPLPVTFGQRDTLNQEYQSAVGGGANIQDAATADRTPPDTRSLWQKIAPTWLGGKEAPEATAPRGPGSGGRVGNTGDAMRFAMDQLRREGVPEANLPAAAALLTGQASMESGIDPNKSHDGGTGYGIYGARLERRSRMLAWLKANNYPANSLEGQMRYMAHEAMTDPTYGASRTALMGASRDTLARDSGILTRNFERPAVANDRSGATLRAYRTGPSSDAVASAGSYVIGDSIAQGVRDAMRAGGNTQVGVGPKTILDRINALPDASLAGKRVVLSSGASNSVRDAGMAADEIKALKAKGASDIVLLGVGDRGDFQAAKLNDRLSAIARDNGAAFQGIGDTPGGVHPSSYKRIADALNERSPAPVAAAPAAPAYSIGDKNWWGGMSAWTSPSAAGGLLSPQVLDEHFRARAALQAGAAAGSAGAGDVTHNNVTQKVDVHVDGTMDPEGVARMVGSNVRRTYTDLTSNLQGAAQ